MSVKEKTTETETTETETTEEQPKEEQPKEEQPKEEQPKEEQPKEETTSPTQPPTPNTNTIPEDYYCKVRRDAVHGLKVGRASDYWYITEE